MKNKLDIVYVNHDCYGFIKDNKFEKLNMDDQAILIKKIENKIKQKDCFRRIISYSILGLIILAAITLAILMVLKVFTLGTGQWFNYTFVLLGLVILWAILYILLGFIFYSRLKINYHFKKSDSTDPSCITYASSNYYKYIDKYIPYLLNTGFSYTNEKGQIKTVGFSLKKPSIKNIIFNGHICCNVPYYYFYFNDAKIVFLPTMILFIKAKQSKAISYKEFKIERKEKTYHLYFNDKLMISFICHHDFDINFFGFKY